MKRGFILLVCVVFIFGVRPERSRAQQLHFVFDNSIPVTSSSVVLPNPWCGALQAPQFSTIDVDNDADKDLFVFDRYDNSILVFLNDNGVYKYAADYQALFPKMSGWVVLRDYNCDGKEDIFTASAGGVAVYENTSVGNNLSFSQVTAFLTGVSGPVMVPFSDIPVLEDVDFDGDLDILTFDVAGTYVVFYKNLRVENGLTCNVLNFDTETICWGDFREGGTGNDVTLGDDCGGNIPVYPLGEVGKNDKGVVHSGSSLTAFDSDGDNDMDLVIGDITSNSLVFLRNGNNAADAIMDQAIDSFPLSHPVNIHVYVAAYYQDVTFDGKRDLIVAPNEGAEVSGRNYNQIWLYENTGTDAAPVFSFSKENFLTEGSIELGAGSAPQFLDYDADGDMDLVVGNFAYRLDQATMVNTLTLFENKGTTDSARFEMVDTDFANTQSLGLFNTVPAFGDLDADGDIDMMLGEYSGKLYYFKNSAGPGATVNLVLDSVYFGGLDVGSTAAPELVDIDGDSDLDLIVGERNGNVNFFENQGDSTTPHFVIISDSVGKIDITSIINAGYTVPRVLDFDKDGKLDLVLGTYTGSVLFYSNLEDNLFNKMTPINDIYYNTRSNAFEDVNFGRRSAPALTDLNGDSLPDMIAGLFRGGLIYFRNESDSTIGIPELVSHNEIRVYPNPSDGVFSVRINAARDIFSGVVLDALGRRIKTMELVPGENQFSMKGSPSGVYTFIVLNEIGVVYKQKLLILD